MPQLLTFENGAEEFSAEETAALEALAEEAARALVAMRETEGAGIAAELAPRIAALRREGRGPGGSPGGDRPESGRHPSGAGPGSCCPRSPLDPGPPRAGGRPRGRPRRRRRGAPAAARDTWTSSTLSSPRPPEAVGKTLDFLSQEILRELNTLGSKSRDLLSTREILEMKAETEKIREQVQNVE